MFVVDPVAGGVAGSLQDGEGGQGGADQVAIAAQAALGAGVRALAERLGDASAAQAVLGERGAMRSGPQERAAAGCALVVQRLDQAARRERSAGPAPAPEPEADVGLLDGQPRAV